MNDAIIARPHPLLRPAAFITELPSTLDQLPTPAWLADLLQPAAPAPMGPDDAVRGHVRDALRTAGYKPTGRGKPASEYLVRAAAERTLSSINLPVDACNVVSLHSGFPISVVDLDRARPPFRIAIAVAGESYVFNPSGQEIGLAGLTCLYDHDGPCANPVKDAQRTKTGPSTQRTLSVLWGCAPHDDRAARAVAWYRELLERAGATTRTVPIEAGPAPGDAAPPV
jgi:DNA/RNA-binding domain of Phe-tRNA-synthetase-like protein